MPKISINLLGYKHRQLLPAAIDAVLAQTYRDFELIYTDNCSDDGSVELVRRSYPQIRIVENRQNTGYAGGHNGFFAQAESDLVMVLNPDAILEPDFLERVIVAFDDPQVAAVTGKMLRPAVSGKPDILDGTGIVVSRTRRARERGQNEEDHCQYDGRTWIFGVSGTAAVYRRSALERVKLAKNFFASAGGYEYFDEDFFAYWEDLDLAWRLRLHGYECRYVPKAIVRHKRLASSSPGGYGKFFQFVRHHRGLPLRVRRWNWKNHLFCIIKNDFGFPLLRDLPFIAVRELAMLGYILIFEPAVLGAVPEFFRQLPKMLQKRKHIMRHRTMTSRNVGGWFAG